MFPPSSFVSIHKSISTLRLARHLVVDVRAVSEERRPRQPRRRMVVKMVRRMTRNEQENDESDSYGLQKFLFLMARNQFRSIAELHHKLC